MWQPWCLINSLFILNNVKNVNPTFEEDTSKECSNRILFSIYRHNHFSCCLWYCNGKYKSYPASKGLAQMIYLMFPLMPWISWDHTTSFTTCHHSCHQQDTSLLRNTGASQDMLWEAETFNLDRDDKLICSVPFTGHCDPRHNDALESKAKRLF